MEGTYFRSIWSGLWLLEDNARLNDLNISFAQLATQVPSMFCNCFPSFSSFCSSPDTTPFSPNKQSIMVTSYWIGNCAVRAVPRYLKSSSTSVSSTSRIRFNHGSMHTLSAQKAIVEVAIKCPIEHLAIQLA